MGPRDAESTSRRTRTRRRLGGLSAATLVAGLLAAGGALAPPAGAQPSQITLYVSQSGTATTGCTESDPCQTISDAVTAAADHASDEVTIEVAASSTAYGGPVVIDSSNPSLTIDGAGASSTTLSGGGSGCDVTIEAGNVVIDDLTITDGSGTNCGGIYNEDYLTLEDDVISDDTATGDGGGGLDNDRTASVTDVTFTNDTTTGNGGGVYNEATGSTADTTISGSAFTDDSAAEGGAIFNGGGITLTTSTLDHDTATSQGGGLANYDDLFSSGATLDDDSVTGTNGSGGGAYNASELSLLNDSLVDDTAKLDGGGVDSTVTLSAERDTFSGDKAADGAAIDSESGTTTIENDTISGDAASAEGGGILASGSVQISDVTLASDTARSGPGLDVGGSVSLADSILDHAGCAKASGTLTDDGYNVESDDSCGLGSTDKVNSSTINLAGSLAANGSAGPETLAIGIGSSALGEVPLTSCTITIDERGDPRPGLASLHHCDAGAYEFGGGVPSAPRHASATAGVKSVKVSWKAPASDGGYAITGYDVFCASKSHVVVGPKPTKTTKPTVTSASVVAAAGKKLYCLVVAVNEKGDSPPSATVSATAKA